MYFSVATISTVGYGDLTPQSDIGKIFTIFYMLVGIGLFVALVTQLARSLVVAPATASGRNENEEKVPATRQDEMN